MLEVIAIVLICVIENGLGVEPGDISLIVSDEGKAVLLTEDKFLVVVSLIDVEGGFVGVIVIVEVLEKFVDENRIIFSILLVLLLTREFVELENILGDKETKTVPDDFKTVVT